MLIADQCICTVHISPTSYPACLFFFFFCNISVDPQYHNVVGTMFDEYLHGFLCLFGCAFLDLD